MPDLIVLTMERTLRSETVRLVALWAFTAFLAVAFLAMLVGDQVQAASF
jgi:hypothetical protein